MTDLSVSHLSWITVLYCPLFCVLKTVVLYIFPSFIGWSRWKSKSSVCYSLLKGSKSPMLFYGSLTLHLLFPLFCIYSTTKTPILVIHLSKFTSFSLSSGHWLTCKFSLTLSSHLGAYKGEGGNRGWDSWMVSLTQWTWVWANSGR